MEKKLLAKYINKSGDNTIRVEVEDVKKHPKYKKYLKKTKKYLVHISSSDFDTSKLSIGDKVLIKSTRPISKRKSFVFLKKISEVSQ
ncbi:30S ribosomal protein S17 [bacterium]|nr:30S ribosomal protein S17 [bacterium]